MGCPSSFYTIFATLLRYGCMKKTLLSFLAVVLCLGSVCGQQKMDKMTYWGHLYLESQVNGHVARLAFDTGSPYTCIDSTYLADSGLQYNRIGNATVGGTGNGQEKVRVIMAELTYTAGGKEYKSHLSPILQLKPILGDQADGILGIDRMGGKVIAIDYVGERMGFWDRLGDTVGYTSFPIRYEDNRIYVPLTVVVRDGITITGRALMDLGSGGSVDLTSVVAQAYNLKDITPQLPLFFAVGGVGGEASECDFRAKSVSVGGYTLEEVVMSYSHNSGGFLSKDDIIGIVGNEFWERFDLIIDLAGKRLYMRPNANYGKPFESPVRGFGCTYRSRTLGCWVVNGLYQGSHAEKVGLRNGDRIIAVNGRSVKEISFEESRGYFDGMKAVCLTVQRDGTTTEIAFRFDAPKL